MYFCGSNHKKEKKKEKGEGRQPLLVAAEMEMEERKVEKDKNIGNDTILKLISLPFH